MKHTIYVVALLWLFSSVTVFAQTDSDVMSVSGPDTTGSKPSVKNPYNDELDVIDIARNVMHKGVGKRVDTGDIKSKKLRLSLIPAAGYTLQTGFAGLLAGNATFYTHPEANTSTILSSLTYTVRNQIILPLQTSLWTKNNDYNIIIDWRFLYYPSYTYGLGGYTTLSDGYLISYSTIHLRQAILRKLAPAIYAGLGYNIDYFWGIKELNPPNNHTDFKNYGLSPTEFAAGVTFNFLYDTRSNPVNAQRGNFVNVIYRPNLSIFGNTETWRSLVVDLRKYVPFPAGSNNVLAFWSYEWLTLNGKPPYLMLPNTGGDPYSNTGRGYIQGRFRGKNMAYLESEYRFRLTNNGLLGGVVFANAQSFTEESSNKFETIAPGYGAGLRIKFNKFSRTNVALDYGFGEGGSSGLFVNIGEVF